MPFELNTIIFLSTIQLRNNILNIPNGTRFERNRRHPSVPPPNPLGNPLPPGPPSVNQARARGPAGYPSPVRFLHLALPVWHAEIES